MRLSHLLQRHLLMEYSPLLRQELLVAARKLLSLPRVGLWGHILSKLEFDLWTDNSIMNFMS